MADDEVTQMEDAGDRWLTFCSIAILAAILSAIPLSTAALGNGWWVAAIPIGIAAGWSASLIRPLRRFVSEGVRFLLSWT